MLGVSRVVDHQMRGVGVRKLSGGFGRLLGGMTEVVGVETLVLDDPADHRQRQRAVRAWLQRQPGRAVAHHAAAAEHRVDDDVLEAARPRARPGGVLGHGLHREVGVAGLGAPENNEFRFGNVRLGHVLTGIDRCGRNVVADLADVHVLVVVDAAEGLAEAAREGEPTADDAPALEYVAIGPMAKLRRARIHRFVALDVQPLEAEHVEVFARRIAGVGENLSPIGHFGDELLPADGLPLAAAPPALALQRHGDAVGIVRRLYSRIAARADRSREGCCLQERHVGSGIFRQGMRMVRVAENALDAPGLAVDLDPQAAFAVALLIDGVAKRPVRIGRELAVGAAQPFRAVGIAVDAMQRLATAVVERNEVVEGVVKPPKSDANAADGTSLEETSALDHR